MKDQALQRAERGLQREHSVVDLSIGSEGDSGEGRIGHGFKQRIERGPPQRQCVGIQVHHSRELGEAPQQKLRPIKDGADPAGQAEARVRKYAEPDDVPNASETGAAQEHQDIVWQVFRHQNQECTPPSARPMHPVRQHQNDLRIDLQVMARCTYRPQDRNHGFTTTGTLVSRSVRCAHRARADSRSTCHLPQSPQYYKLVTPRHLRMNNERVRRMQDGLHPYSLATDVGSHHVQVVLQEGLLVGEVPNQIDVLRFLHPLRLHLQGTSRTQSHVANCSSGPR
mmetsp:Transcript_134716/g.430388  ORF Transcript_134716/g.430388 Transcript_134716/m.430388 type:complete len:282 (+) Transcript_134716:1388-2233(+)